MPVIGDGRITPGTGKVTFPATVTPSATSNSAETNGGSTQTVSAGAPCKCCFNQTQFLAYLTTLVQETSISQSDMVLVLRNNSLVLVPANLFGSSGSGSGGGSSQSFIVEEDDSSLILLEDGSGSLILETT